MIIGAGLRGRDTYGAFALANPASLRVVAVAEPDAERRQLFARAHRLPAERLFGDWRALLDGPRVARVAIIATRDHVHVEPAVAALPIDYEAQKRRPPSHPDHRLIGPQHPDPPPPHRGPSLLEERPCPQPLAMDAAAVDARF